jgi:hypothetical protein
VSQTRVYDDTGQGWLSVRPNVDELAHVSAGRPGVRTEPQAERAGSRGAAPGAAQPRNLDTSTTRSPGPRNASVFHPSKQPALPLPGTQLGLDGAAYLPKPAKVDGPRVDLPDVPVEERYQLAFDFSAGPVQLGFDDWRGLTADALEWFEWGTGKNERRAQRLRDCGSMIAVPFCKHCHELDLKGGVRSASCATRCCPACQREESKERRKNLRDAFRTWPYSRRGVSPWMLTITVPHDYATSVTRLRNDAEKAFRGARLGWNYLATRGAKRAYVKLEVGTRGMVHVHLLVWMPWQPPAALAQFRALVSSVTGGQHVNFKRANKGGVRELAKYFTKGVARADSKAEQTHPLLAAMVDVAFRGARLVREWGDWDGQGFEPPKLEPWSCPSCGCCDERSLRYLDAQQFRRALLGGP